MQKINLNYASDYDSILYRYLRRYKTALKKLGKDHAVINRAPLEDAIFGRPLDWSMKKAAHEWLKSFLANELLEDEKGVAKFIRNHLSH